MGVFISITPFFGIHTPLAIAAAFLFRLNKLTTITGAWVNTPLTVVPMLAASYKLGEYLLGAEPRPFTLTELSWTALKPYAEAVLLGSSLIGLAAAVAGYFLLLLAGGALPPQGSRPGRVDQRIAAGRPGSGAGPEKTGSGTVVTRERVIEKVRKLLALSNSSNEHEAALAAAHAQRLLAGAQPGHVRAGGAGRGSRRGGTASGPHGAQMALGPVRHRGQRL